MTDVVSGFSRTGVNHDRAYYQVRLKADTTYEPEGGRYVRAGAI